MWVNAKLDFESVSSANSDTPTNASNIIHYHFKKIKDNFIFC